MFGRGKKQRQILGQDLSDRHARCIKYYEEHGYNITSKIYRGAEHRGIFSRSNPCLDALMRDIIKFYKYGESFKADITSVEKINMNPQRQRESKLKEENKDK